MENYHLYEKRAIPKSKAPATRWVKEWVPQEIISTGGKCFALKWVTEDSLKSKAKVKEPKAEEQEPEPSTEVLFLCSYDDCGKTFIDAGALRKHSHIHGERQYVCHYDKCGRKFLDSSKLKRHFLIHTGERNFICPHEGCGKAFSLDFNLRAHMRTHSQENYHICPYADCGKRYAHEYKLKTHIKSHHEKQNSPNNVIKHTPPIEKTPAAIKPPAVVYGSASSDRPYACPYEGCDKSYIHEYKLNLHLRREHPGHNPEENNGKRAREADNEMDEGSDQDPYGGKNSSGKNVKRAKTKPATKMVTPKVVPQRKAQAVVPTNYNLARKPLPSKEAYEEEDSEETEEEDHVDEDGWRYAENNDDDEETEFED